MTMTKTQVISLLRENKNERGIANWQKRGRKNGPLKSFGIGLTQLRMLAKQVGRDHALAKKLWQSDCYDAKVIGLLIDEPKKITREQAEEQVEELHDGLFAHVFATCNASLAKTPFVFELCCDWMESKDEMRRRCGYSLLYELSKKKIAAMNDTFYLKRIGRISETIEVEPVWVKMAMGGALMGIGKRNKKLNKACIQVAKAVGPIDFDNGTGKCEPFDTLKHLTSDYLKKKFSKE